MADLNSILSVTPRPYLPPARAHPFVKWAGGKRALIPEIAARLPDALGTYWEPFTGGGAVFFALDGLTTAARLSDINSELIITYAVVRNHPERLIDALRVHEGQHKRSGYYVSVRKQRDAQDAVEVAARFIYLNKTCFNGLYRVNKSGQFNVPKGRYKNPKICDADNIQNASEVLRKARLRYGGFDEIDPNGGDFVYCDPPYDGASVAYAPHGFDDDDQQALRDAAARWARQGVNVMLSNADTPLIRSLYRRAPFTLHEVQAPRSISCDGNGRGKVGELIITTYG